MASTKKKSLYLAAESTYGTDPSTNGSGYTPIPAMPVGEIVDELEQLATNYSTGRLHDTAPVVGPDGASLSFTVPLIGLSAEAGDGASPPADDWLDIILTHIFGAQTKLDGEGVATGSTSTNLVLDTDEYGVGDLLPYNLGTGVTQWVRVTADAADGSYTVAPAMSPLAVDAGVIYGSTRYRFTDGGGATLSAVLVDDTVGTYRLGGGRVTGFVISGGAGQMYSAEVTMRFDAAAEDASAKTSLPAALTAPVVTPLKAMLSPVRFNGTAYPSASTRLDFGIEATRVQATSGTNGRSGDVVIRLSPMLTIVPLRTDAIRELRRLVTQGPVDIHFGAGVRSGGALNSMAATFGNAFVEQVSAQDDAGLARQSVTIKAIDAGAAGVHFQVARA